MSELSLPVEGFSAAEAVWRILRRKGYGESLTAFNDTWLLDGTPASMIPPLESEGVQARIAVVTVDEFVYLKPPVLMQLSDRAWVIATGMARNGIFLETAEGTRCMERCMLAPRLSGCIIDISDTFTGGASFWRHFFALVAINKTTVSQIVLATIALQLLSLIFPEITAVTMNRALPDSAASMVQLIAAGIVLLAVFQAWTGWLRGRMLLYLTTRVGVSMEQGFLDHLLRLPFLKLQGKTLGDMLQAYLGLVTANGQLIERGLGAMLGAILSITYLVSMSGKLFGPTLVVIAAATVMSLFAVAVGRIQAVVQLRQVEARAKQHGFLAELLSGCKTVKSAGAEDRCINRWAFLFTRGLSLELRKQRLGLWSEVGLTTLQQATSVTMLVWGAHHCLSGTLPVGTLFAFIQLSNGFLGSVFGIVNFYLVVCLMRPQLAKTQAIFDTDPEPRMKHICGAIRSLKQPVIMEDVWFRYAPDLPWILKGYSLMVKPGAKQTLRGATGSGKSTVLRLLAGLYTPEKGTISIGGLIPAAAQDRILYLPQFTNLYAGSIIENLRILSGGVSVETIMNVARTTGLHDFVAALPMNYHTLLAPGGRSLSGGQRQLIMLTAAMASGRALILLDESTASIDTSVSSRLLELISLAACTVVMASHTASGDAA